MQQSPMPLSTTITTAPDAPPVVIPHGYVGRVVFPATGREVFWTGRVAIGLRWQPAANQEMGEHAGLLQVALLYHAA